MNLTAPRLLVAEDDASLRATLAVEFAERGFLVREVAAMADLLALPWEPIDYAVVDLRLGRDNGLELVTWLLGRAPRCRIVVLTGYGSIATAVRAMKLGAVNFLTKPISVSHLAAALLGKEPTAGPAPDAIGPLPTLATHERDYIETVLSDCGGNVSQAARALGLHRQSLQRKLRKFYPT